MRLELPDSRKDERALVDALDAELCPAEVECNMHLVAWKIIDAYLEGVRRFRILDRLSGNLSIAFENKEGGLDFRYEAVAAQFLTEMGRFMKMNVSPVASRKGESLDALRKGAIAHATLGATTAPIDLDKVKRKALIPFLKYGTVGLAHYEGRGPDGKIQDRIEVVHPRELRGLPGWVDGLDNMYGLARKRWVPMDWVLNRLKSAYGWKEPKDLNPRRDFRATEVTWGSAPPGKSSYETSAGGTSPAQLPQQRTPVSTMDPLSTQTPSPGEDLAKSKRRGRLYVPLEEVYILDDTGDYVARFIIKIGEKIVHDEDYEGAGSMYVCPLQVARHSDIGKFFARGFVGPLIPFNSEIEKMLQAVFKNVAEMDMFGTLFVSSNHGINLKRWKTGPRPKVELYHPDMVTGASPPFALKPGNSGLLPAKVVEFATKVSQSLSKQGPYYQGETSGRVDSAAGLGFLFNTGNIALGLPTNGFADAFVGVYRRLLQVARGRRGENPSIYMTMDSDAVAGVKIDPQTGAMDLADNPIPNPWEVKVDIKDRTPREPEVRKQELDSRLQLGLVDYTRYWITVFEENLDVPGAPRELWETWRKAMWQIVVLFGDGRTPGKIELGPHDQNPDVQLVAVQTFMNKIEYSLASEEVQARFREWKEALEQLAGRKFPEQLPPPEEIARQEAEARKAQQAQQQGGLGGMFGAMQGGMQGGVPGGMPA